MSSIFTNDQSLIRALKKGDPKAYNFLVDTYHHKLCIYAHGLTKDHDLSEDIVQNVFEYVWKNRLKLKDEFSVKNYLYRAIYNEFIDQYRKRKSVLEIERKYTEALNRVVKEEDETSFIKLVAIVKKEIENLPPKCKQTFLLSKQEGLTNIEISEYLDISIKSVEAHITKAFSILREKVGNRVGQILFLLFGKEQDNYTSIRNRLS